MPRDGLAEVALVGRSNVGKSSLINALVGQPIARTSATPGKTRLANVYRIVRGGTPFYLVDLPGFGFARGDRAELEAVTQAYFGGERSPEGSRSHVGEARGSADRARGRVDGARGGVDGARGFSRAAALLLVDARHPGLANDLEAWRWLTATVDHAAIVATKVDKLSRAERQRARTANEAAFEHPVWPVSARTGEGLDELWKLIEQLLNLNPSSRRRSPPHLPRQKN